MDNIEMKDNNEQELFTDKRQDDQLKLNCEWLIDKIDRIHGALCGDQIGTWQQRAEQAVKAVEYIASNVSPTLNERYPQTHQTFKHGDAVKKRSGSQWHGTICGWYSTTLSPEGYAVESFTETGSVQIYPAKALEDFNPTE
jgi:dihydrofolate reductase (trimethoprim resistance protein)